MKNILTTLCLCAATTVSAQTFQNSEVFDLPEMNQSSVREVIQIPDILGYKTLKCDFHMHTSFSDGSVWPTVRIDEAWSEGLDAISITDHIEYRPNKNILKGDLNESYKIAEKRAKAIDFLLVKGIEITRSKPLGHLNALFITDAEPLDVKDPIQAIETACEQGAFIMWNHPGWPDNKATLYPVHEKLIKEKKIHGVETFNELEYYPVSFDWCREKNLAFMGCSDVHGLVSTLYGKEKNARPLTLVFAKDRSVEGIKEALFAGRSAALFNGELAGKADLLTALLKESLSLRTINAEKGEVEIINTSDIPFVFKTSAGTVTIPADKAVRTKLPLTGTLSVLNCHTGSNTSLTLNLPLAEL
jgi:hypothetical protein